MLISFTAEKLSVIFFFASLYKIKKIIFNDDNNNCYYSNTFCKYDSIAFIIFVKLEYLSLKSCSSSKLKSNSSLSK